MDVRDVVETLQAFNEVKKSCFGQTVANDFKISISKFAEAYDKLGVSVTPKVHAVLVHIPEFLDQNLGHGLGYWSEQASESVHYDFGDLWVTSSYKRSRNHKDYADQLLKFNVTYNSRHL